MEIFSETVSTIIPQDVSWRKRGRQRLDQLVMPHWALGRLMDLAVDLAGMTRSLNPVVRRKVIVIMAADHGVVDEGVSKYPRDVTWQMVENFVRRGAGINALAAQAGADVRVVDMGVAKGMGELACSGSILSMPLAQGTANMALGPAMTREQAVSSIENGIRVARRMIGEEGYDLIGVGEMGIGNTTPSSAIITVFSGASAFDTTGPGTGIDDGQMCHKIEVIERAIQMNRPDPEDGLDVLAKIGGFEIGGIAGVILGAAALQKPVLVDGLITTAGALIARSLAPASADYMIAAHRSAEKGHILALRRLGREPLLDLGLRLGEGTGAALAMNLVEAAVRILTDVSTFSEAGVSGAVG
jgi:nicotinate-nucleotide--dimethylbenzimidazole phosphoribosyltransferase